MHSYIPVRERFSLKIVCPGQIPGLRSADNRRLIAYDRTHLILMTSIIKNPFGRRRIKERIISVINEMIIILRIISLPRLLIFSYLHFQNLQQWGEVSFLCGVKYFLHTFQAKMQPAYKCF